jgi:hypothetical protein
VKLTRQSDGIRLSDWRFVFMSKRGKRGGKGERCFIQLDNQLQWVPPPRWRQWLVAGLLILVGGQVAKPAVEGVFRFEGGAFKYPEEPIAPRMPLNCYVIERHGVFDTRGPKLRPRELQAEILADYQD